MTEPTMLEHIEDVNTQLRQANALLQEVYWKGPDVHEVDFGLADECAEDWARTREAIGRYLGFAP
jgi:hypothetical protein